MRANMVVQRESVYASRTARRQPGGGASPFVLSRRAISRDEFWQRCKFAEAIFDRYIQRRLMVNSQDAHAFDYGRDSSGPTGDTPTINDVACWVLTIEKVFIAIGREESIVLAARLQRKPVPWADLSARHCACERDMKDRFRCAVIAFTDELTKRGIDERISAPRAA